MGLDRGLRREVLDSGIRVWELGFFGERGLGVCMSFVRRSIWWLTYVTLFDFRLVGEVGGCGHGLV